MKCIKCPGKPYYNGLCRKHFGQQIEARIRKEIRSRGLIKKNDVLIVKEPIVRHFIQRIMGGMPLRILKAGKGKPVELWTLDDEIISFLARFLDNAEQEKPLKNTIRPFRTVKEDELIAFAKLAKVKFKKKKRTKREEEIKKAVEKIDKKHQETKFSLLKSADEIRSLT